MILKEVKPGNSVTIRKLNSTGSVKKKLMDMGLTKKYGNLCTQGCAAGRSHRVNCARL